ncbi:hypothetical protein SAMN04488109_0896 [Chryseolinea serpens]|uniref:EpsG family protein n=1 Tax=Chryseolinea serpens TaxID=947013 RepID=A0A1M5KY68_9BACT|nr:hypothetical protein [Chryseolinea serpens]SHG57449.1 hypothetical protein SAMN04488109_0896 [Chryseolinea serpens]
MLGGILILFLTGVIAFSIIDTLKKRHPFVNVSFLRNLFFYHTALAFVYYLYALFNPSDSNFYYEKVTNDFRGDTWASFYGTSTTFIEFIGYPFIKYLGFSYEASMALFAFFGFIGYLYLYLFIRENIKFNHRFLGYDLLALIFFLPNVHFWSSSFGKGSVIFMGIALFFYGISHIRGRWISVAIGAFIIYHVRPHIMLVMLASSGIGFVFTNKGISVPLRMTFLFCVTAAFFFIYRDVFTMVGVDEQEFVTQGIDLSHRATELAKATSGVDITNYSLPMQLFTFLYRPLFVDAPGVLGLIVSFENVFYLLITFQLINAKGLQFLIRGNFLVKTAFFSFLTVSIALAQVSGNLGLAIRQKSQVMLLFMFVVIAFLDQKKMAAYKQAQRQRLRRTPNTAAEENLADRPMPT